MAEEQSVTEGTGKVCPDCAESVQAAARVCRHCGYRFDTGVSGARAGSTPAPPPQKSSAGAAILSLVVPGLGHFYLREGWRGGVFLAAFVVATIGAFLTGTIGPGWIIGVAGAIDAYRGAQRLKTANRLTRDLDGQSADWVRQSAGYAGPREVAWGHWAMLLVVIGLATAGVVVNEQRLRDEEQRLVEEEQRLQQEVQRLRQESEQLAEPEPGSEAPGYSGDPALDFTTYDECLADGYYLEFECSDAFLPMP